MSGWTEDRIEKLKKLYAEGHSASLIADRLGGVSRNAVIGKVMRLGLPPRRSSHLVISNARAVRKRNAPRPPVVRKPNYNFKKPSQPIVRESVPLDNPADVARVSFEAMDHKCHCRWPVGDPRAKNFGFCGLPPVEGKPYCEGHVRASTRVPMVTRRVVRPTPSDEIKINTLESVEA